MDTLPDRLAELADDAPMGGAPAAVLWARGKRTHRIRAAALAATLLVVGAGSTGIGVRLADVDGDRSYPSPAGSVDIPLIEYPVGKKLPDLGDTPGPLVAVWLSPRAGGGAPEAVGLVAETGAFGTLPIDVLVDVEYGAAADPGVALSPDGRRIAYIDRKSERGEVVVHDLVSGENELPTIENHGLHPYDWIDATHLYGSASGPRGTTDTSGWVWEPGTAATLVDLGQYPGQPYLGYGWPYGGTDLEIGFQGPRLCTEPLIIAEATPEDPQGQPFHVAVLCDVVGVVGSEVLLGHLNAEHLAGELSDPKYADGPVVALDIQGTERPYFDEALPGGPDADHAFDDPALRRVVVTAGAPHRVTFATDLIAEALEAEGGAS